MHHPSRLVLWISRFKSGWNKSGGNISSWWFWYLWGNVLQGAQKVCLRFFIFGVESQISQSFDVRTNCEFFFCYCLWSYGSRLQTPASQNYHNWTNMRTLHGQLCWRSFQLVQWTMPTLVQSHGWLDYVHSFISVQRACKPACVFNFRAFFHCSFSARFLFVIFRRYRIPPRSTLPYSYST